MTGGLRKVFTLEETGFRFSELANKECVRTIEQGRSSQLSSKGEPDSGAVYRYVRKCSDKKSVVFRIPFVLFLEERRTH
jgi:hypothetical protein